MGAFEQLEAGETTARIYVAGEPGPGKAGVVVFHAWWGLNDDATAYADRLAAEGFFAVAPDLYGGEVVTTIEEAQRAVRQVDEATSDAITDAATAYLAERLGSDARIGTVGFSFGASGALVVPTRTSQGVASVLYYGTTDVPLLTGAATPVLGHFAEGDPYEDDAWVAEVEETLSKAGRDVTFHRYANAGHWFAEPSRDAYRQEAADLAFGRTVAFFQEHLAASPA